jgi:Protein of unknown function (DUF3261)
MRRCVARASMLLFAIGYVALLPGCTNFGPGLSGTPCPVAWVPTESMDPTAAALRARMQLRIRDEEIHLELIAETRPEEVVVVALARFGVRLFAVHQRGSDVRVVGASTPDLEQVAIWVMDALHRAFWIEAPEGVETEIWNWAGEEVSQYRREAALRREFSLSGSKWSGSDAATSRVTIDYLDPELDPEPGPERGAESVSGGRTVSIRNPWCGYDAVIVPVRTAPTRIH